MYLALYYFTLSEFHWHDLTRCSIMCLLIIKSLRRIIFILYGLYGFKYPSWIYSQHNGEKNLLLCYNSAKWETLLEDPTSFLGIIGLLGWMTDRSDGYPAIQRTLAGWRDGPTQISLGQTTGNDKVLPLGRKNAVQLTSWEASWQKRTHESWWRSSWPCHVPCALVGKAANGILVCIR